MTVNGKNDHCFYRARYIYPPQRIICCSDIDETPSSAQLIKAGRSPCHPKRVRVLAFAAMRHISDVLADVLRGLAPALAPETKPEAPPHNVRPAPASSPRPDARVSPSLCRILP